MAFIAYATGAELRIDKYRKLLKKILIISLTIVLIVFLVVTFVAWVRTSPCHRARFDPPPASERLEGSPRLRAANDGSAWRGARAESA